MSEYQFDFLVVGSGLAGLLFALEAADHGRVAVLSKRSAEESSTQLAQGGIAAVEADDDSFEQHAADTIEAGAGLCHPDVVEGVVSEGPSVIELLESHGVTFARADGGRLDLGREGGHSRRRVVHVADETGKAIETALLRRARSHPNISIFEHHCAVDLVTDSKLRAEAPKPNRTRVLGAYVLECSTREIHTFAARVTLLATGGAGKVYRYTSNPDLASGDGLAMAFRAGARLANLEFVQFHPTCLYHPEHRRFLISEAVRGEGAVLRTLSGESFMEKYHPLGSLAPRDTVARAIDQEMKKSGEKHVLLDLSAIPPERIKKRFPMIYGTCLALGLDITRQPIPVVPAAHYMCGGVVTDGDGRTDLVDLYAAGEVACTGLHGANRLASNSLLEAAVFARRAARAAVESMSSGRGAESGAPPIRPWDPGKATVAKESVLVNAHWDMIRALMWDFVGIVRNDHRLDLAARYLRFFRESVESYYWDFVLDSDLVELRNIALLASLIVGCASKRTESRGLHYNMDHPDRDDTRWARETIVDPVAGEIRRALELEIPFGRRASAWER